MTSWDTIYFYNVNLLLFTLSNPFWLSYLVNRVTTILDFSPRNSSILLIVKHKRVHQLRKSHALSEIQTWDLRHSCFLNLQYDALDGSATKASNQLSYFEHSKLLNNLRICLSCFLHRTLQVLFFSASLFQSCISNLSASFFHQML